MVLNNVRLMDNAVTTGKVAADTIIPADVDETQAYNFSSTSGTFAGKISASTQDQALNLSSSSGTFAGKLTGATQPTAINFTSASGTFAGKIAASTQDTALNISSNSSTFDGVFGSNATTVKGYNFNHPSGTFSGRISGVLLNVEAGSVTVNIAGSMQVNFSRNMPEMPTVSLTRYGASTAAAAATSIVSVSTANFQIFSAAGTVVYFWQAVAQSG